jgi:hypothetical protein
MESIVFIIQCALAAIFGFSGILKIMEPIDKLLISGLTWVGRFSVNTVRLIGFFEILGALGLVLPDRLQLGAAAVSLAAWCLSCMILLAMIHHLRHKEFQMFLFCGLLLVGNLLVLYTKMI